jgi:Pyruvate/2-oxoacid:ferredoxin oxidoreductase gamma subunit
VLILEEDLLSFSSPVLDFDVSTLTRRMNPNGYCVVNSPKKPNKLGGDIAGRPVTVDGTKISLEYLKSPFYMNMAVIGAYLAFRKTIDIEDMERAIKEFINPRGHKILEGKMGEMNIKALRAGYESAKF